MVAFYAAESNHWQRFREFIKMKRFFNFFLKSSDSIEKQQLLSKKSSDNIKSYNKKEYEKCDKCLFAEKYPDKSYKEYIQAKERRYQSR